MPHQLDDQRRDILGERMRISRVVGDMDLADTGDLRRRLRDTIDALAGDEQMHLAQLRCGGDRRQRGILYRRAIMLDPYERLHLAIPMACSLVTSSSTSATLIPAWRLPGSTTFSVVMRA